MGKEILPDPGDPVPRRGSRVQSGVVQWLGHPGTPRDTWCRPGLPFLLSLLIVLGTALLQAKVGKGLRPRVGGQEGGQTEQAQGDLGAPLGRPQERGWWMAKETNGVSVKQG